MDQRLEALLTASAAGRDLYRPIFFRLNVPDDRTSLDMLLNNTPGIRVHNELLAQIRELVRCTHPSVRYSKEDLNEAALAHLNGTPALEYGVWVFYPWSNRLVHLLDKDEFALVRTDRNRNKITREEQTLLATKRIGVIGLSVGQSICLALAMERSVGELRIADYDTLDLSNLNRIRIGAHELNTLKTVAVAREIAEIDPFLLVNVHSEGITPDNIEHFLHEGGTLDILVDECDSVDIKVLARQRAKAARIPVVMDTSDRGMLDVERFDLEPERPIFHGLLEGHDELLGAAPSPERNRALAMTIVPFDSLSERMRSSIQEIGRTVTTWPQLATSVLLGGALAAEACRRIALGQEQKSGRTFVEPFSGEMLRSAMDLAQAEPHLSTTERHG